MEELVHDSLLIRYYHESDYHQQLIDELVQVLFDEINFERQIDIYENAKGVAEEWEQLLQEPISCGNAEKNEN